MTGKHWTEDELAYIEYFVYENDTKLKEASEFLGRSLHAVKVKLVQLRKEDKSVCYMNNLWTEKEEEFLKKNYKILTNKNISIRLNRSVKAIEFRAAQLGIQKNKSVKSQDKKIREMIADGYYLIDVSKKLNIKMSSLIAHCKARGIEYTRMPQEEKNRRNPDHIWKQLDQARYAEHLSKKRKEVKV